MNLRFYTLTYSVAIQFAKKLSVFLLLLFSYSLTAQKVPDEELKKEAESLFKKEEYSKAYKLYSQLASNYPKDPVYNFRLGVCMIYSEPDKKKSIPYLRFAAANQGDKELKDVLFYLGKALHMNYRFDEAIKNYNDYKLTASSSQLKKLQVDREIKACSNGKRLLSSLTDLEVLNKAQLSEADYFRNYKKIGGKLLVKPDEFKSKTDKKENEKSVVFLPNGSNVVYFSSYGDNTNSGKDIYTSVKLENGTYSKPEKVEGINTEFDEDYPFLHPDGKTLYFASKGHNSMGGFDIFKSIYDSETNQWSTPVNMEFPINSPDDDYLFVTDSLETTAYFSTGRQSPPGKIDVLKVKTKRRPPEIIAMKGNIIPGSPEYELKSTINVKDIFTQNDLGIFTSKEDGSYSLNLPNGSNLLFTVETPGMETQSAQVSLPVASAAKPYRQTISYEQGKLKILNYFDEPANEDTYLQYLNVIEQKARLDVNEVSTETTPLAVTTNNPQPEDNKKSSGEKTNLGSSSQASTNTKKGLDNKELAKIAREDADELNQQAGQLMRDYAAANEIASKQKADAALKTEAANTALTEAANISDETERQIALDKATKLKEEADSDAALALKIENLAQSLLDDSKAKEKEANLHSEYAKELEKSTKSPSNKNSIAKLEELQKQISEISLKDNESETLVNEIKSEIEQKENEISEAERITAEIKANLEEIRVAITDKESQLSNTRKKSAKKELTQSITDLKEEESEKVQQIAARESEIKKLNEELEVSKKQLETSNQIKNQEIVQQNTPAGTTSKNDLSVLEEKYISKIQVEDPESRSDIEESTIQLKNYNRELDALIGSSKNELNKTKDKAKKEKLSQTIKKSEDLKKQNQTQITTNQNKLIELNKTPVVTSNAAEKPYAPIVAATETEAVKKLESLNTQLNIYDNESFDYNGYQNAQAQSLKIEADARINDAVAKQKQLKEAISASKTDIQTGGGIAQSATALNEEAERLMEQSEKLKQDAKTKNAEEKSQLLDKAKKLEEQANLKYIESAEVTKNDHASILTTNEENIQKLIAEGKSSEEDIEMAETLNEEAKAAFKKATDIRLEGNSLSSIGGKLGSYSNAEEKEQEAILKQQQAIDLLQKSSPDVELKAPITSTSHAESLPGEKIDIQAKLQPINDELNNLLTIKIESYQKLSEANAIEIEELTNTIQANKPVIDNTPSIKTDWISAGNKIESAEKLKEEYLQAQDTNDKLAKLTASVKKQNEAIKQLHNVNTAIQTSLAGSAQISATETKKDELHQTLLEENPLFNDNPETPAGNKDVKTENTTDEFDDFARLSEIETGDAPKENQAAETEEEPESAPIAEVDKQDTTTNQIITYLDDNNLVMRNSQAGASAKNSLSLLKKLEREAAEINESLIKVSQGESADLSPNELTTKASELITEAETSNNKASELREEARNYEGEQKAELIAKANKLEMEAQDKQIEASEYKKRAGEGEYKLNALYIDELISKLKNDEPELASEIEDKLLELEPLKTQLNNLRLEANALNNKAAKLGALSNAEEKELELLEKQTTILNQLKNQYPEYKMTEQVTDPVQKTAELEQRKTTVQEKQYSELTNLINAFSLEYESSKNTIPDRLNRKEKNIKKEADALNAESKKLLIQSTQIKDKNEKIKLLTRAAKTGNKAVEKLNSLLPKPNQQQLNDLEELSKISLEMNNSSNTRTSGSGSTIKIEGLEVVDGNAYSVSNPIPIDSRIEDGLIFRVQIGAFKSRLPNNAFKGLSPLNGETTNTGYIRYTAGNFYKLENANAVKNDLRNLGYSDAFVVVYYNGKRISLTEALAEMEKQGKTVDPNAPQTAGITSNVNVPKSNPITTNQENVVVTKDLDKMDGLLYTIQIGVYTKQITKPQLLNLRPIFREELSNGLFRYTAGIYNNPEKLLQDKTRIVDMGVKDAFVSAYLNGKRIPFAEAKERQLNDSQLKMEAENPVIFPGAPTSSIGQVELVYANTPGITPFKNNVKEYPVATFENGVKTTEEGICYKVQIGAFSKQVPDEVAAKFSSIRSWPVDNKQVNGLFIYNIGNFSEMRFAKALKEEALSIGISDAFITVYRDGKKLYGAEAESYLR